MEDVAETTEPDGGVRPLGRADPKRPGKPAWALVGAVAVAGILFGLFVGGAWRPQSVEPTTTTVLTTTTTTSTPERAVLELPDPTTAGSPLGDLLWTVQEIPYQPWMPVAAGVGFVDAFGAFSTDGVTWSSIPRPNDCPADAAVMTHRGMLALGRAPELQPGGFILRRPAGCLLAADWTWRRVRFAGDETPAMEGNAAAHTETITLLQDHEDLWIMEDADTLERVPDLPFAVYDTWSEPSVWAVGDRFLALGSRLPDRPSRTWWESTDGRMWTEVPEPPGLFVTGLATVVGSGGRTLAGTRFPSSAVWASDDGEDWIELAVPFDPSDDVQIAGGPAGFAALVRSSDGIGAVWISADGELWRPVPSAVFDVTAGGSDAPLPLWGATVVVGADRIVITASVDDPPAALAWVALVPGG